MGTSGQTGMGSKSRGPCAAWTISGKHLTFEIPPLLRLSTGDAHQGIVII